MTKLNGAFLYDDNNKLVGVKNPDGTDSLFSFIATSRAVVTGTADATLAAADLVAGKVFELTGTAAKTFTLDTGTAISSAYAAAFGSVPGGASFQFFVKSSGTVSGTITMAGATGATLSNSAALAIGTGRYFIAVNTAANAWTIY